MGIKRLIDQWNTRTLGGADKLSVSDYHLIQDPIHIQDINIDALELTNTVGQATNTQSQSGAIPNTMKIVSTAAITSSTTTTIFQPDINEVWVCSGMQLDASGGSGSVTAVLHYEDASGTEVRIEAASTSGTAEFNITSTAGPLYVTNAVFLSVTTSSVAGGEQAILSGAFIRVR